MPNDLLVRFAVIGIIDFVRTVVDVPRNDGNESCEMAVMAIAVGDRVGENPAFLVDIILRDLDLDVLQSLLLFPPC